MSVNFSNLWNHENRNHASVSGVSDKNPSGQENVQNSAHTAGEVEKMAAGRTFSGEIVDIDGNEVKIMLDKDTYIQARLEGKLGFSAGQNLVFEVKSNTGGTLALTPLFANLSQNLNIEKALSMANLPVNERTQAMVTAMMEEGMSVGRDALQAMYRQVKAFSQGDVAALVEMAKLKLAVTPENVEQFTNYKNYEHQLTGGIAEILDEIPKALLEMMKAGNPQDAARLLQEIVRIFTPGSTLSGEGLTDTGGMPLAWNADGQQPGQLSGNLLQGGVEVPEPGNLLQGGVGVPEPGNIVPGESGVQEPGNTLQGGAEIQPSVNLLPDGQADRLSGNLLQGEGGVRTSGVLVSDGKTVFRDTAETDAKPLTLQEAMNRALTAGSTAPDGTVRENPASSVSAGGMTLLVQAGVAPEVLRAAAQGNSSPEKLLTAIAEAFVKNGAAHPEAFKKLFESESFRSMLRNQGEKQLLLKPEQVGADKKVEEYYQRLNETVNRLTQVSESVLKDSSPLMKSVTNLQSNVDFMNQLNQTFTYVQLPLKMNQKNANGDLYVFTNKKNLAKKDGDISAFLHLDMSGIGAVDVYVTMKMEKLSTQFYLEREELIDFMEDNMHLLTDRLEEKGYQVTAQVLKKEKDINVVEEMLSQGTSVPLMSKYSFDVRA